MTLNGVIVHVRQFVIALVSVDECSCFLDPDGFLDMLDSSVGLGMMWFSVVVWSVRADLLMIDSALDVLSLRPPLRMG